MPLLPRMVSLPAPPSTVMLIRAARSPVALKLSSPPLHVEDEVFGGADIDAERSRVSYQVKAHARAVGGDREVLGAAAAIDLGDIFGAAAAFVEVGVVARVPNHAVVAAFAEHLVVVIAAGHMAG